MDKLITLKHAYIYIYISSIIHICCGVTLCAKFGQIEGYYPGLAGQACSENQAKTITFQNEEASFPKQLGPNNAQPPNPPKPLKKRFHQTKIHRFPEINSRSQNGQFGTPKTQNQKSQLSCLISSSKPKHRNPLEPLFYSVWVNFRKEHC